MATYNAESGLARLIAPHYARAEDEARSLLREIYASAGDLEVVGDELHVRITPLSAPRRTRALAGLVRGTHRHRDPLPGDRPHARLLGEGGVRPCQRFSVHVGRSGFGLAVREFSEPEATRLARPADEGRPAGATFRRTQPPVSVVTVRHPAPPHKGATHRQRQMGMSYPDSRYLATRCVLAEWRHYLLGGNPYFCTRHCSAASENRRDSGQLACRGARSIPNKNKNNKIPQRMTK